MPMPVTCGATLRPLACLALLAAVGCSSVELPPMAPPAPPPPLPAPVVPLPGSPVPAPAPAAAAPAASAVPAAGTTSNERLQSLLAQWTQRAPQRVHRIDAGSSQLGVPLPALRFSQGGGPRPTVLLVGQQQGDEPAGAEALIALADELAAGRGTEVLSRIDVVMLLRANPDGAAAGRRATAGGIEIEHDMLLLRTPEARAVAMLLRDHRPLVTLDLREYGAPQGPDLLLHDVATPGAPEFITRATEEWFRQPLVQTLMKAGLRSTGWPAGGAGPDSLRDVAELTHSVGLLAATRGIGATAAPLAARVQAQREVLRSVLDSAARRADDLARVRRYVDEEAAAQACRARPCGYWLAADATDAVDRLRAAGVKVETLRDVKPVLAQPYTAGAGTNALVDLPAGSYQVPLAQPLAGWVMAALEPGALGFVAHGVATPAQVARLMGP